MPCQGIFRFPNQNGSWHGQESAGKNSGNNAQRVGLQYGANVDENLSWHFSPKAGQVEIRKSEGRGAGKPAKELRCSIRTVCCSAIMAFRNADDIQGALQRLGKRLLYDYSDPVSLVVCGGSALNVLNIASRTTRDAEPVFFACFVCFVVV